MGKLAISIPAPRTASARAMWPGLITLSQDYEQAFTAYSGLNEGSANGTDPIADSGMIGTQASAPATTTRRQQNRKGTTAGRRKWTAAQRQEQSERAKAVHAARNRKTAGKAMSAGG